MQKRRGNRLNAFMLTESPPAPSRPLALDLELFSSINRAAVDSNYVHMYACNLRDLPSSSLDLDQSSSSSSSSPSSDAIARFA